LHYLNTYLQAHKSSIRKFINEISNFNPEEEENGNDKSGYDLDFSTEIAMLLRYFIKK